VRCTQPVWETLKILQTLETLKSPKTLKAHQFGLPLGDEVEARGRVSGVHHRCACMGAWRKPLHGPISRMKRDAK
jgi:hypothetical protein